MINSKEPLTGVIETNNKAYSFHLNNYSMVFWMRWLIPASHPL